MRNNFFKFFNTIIGLLFFNIVISSSLTLDVSDIDKFQVENNLNSKIANVISNLYNSNQFAVTSNVVLLGTNNISSNDSTSSFGALELEGILPSLPQNDNSGVVTNANNYKIQIKDITLWLDYDIDVVDAQQNIKKFLFESIDWLENCDNCLKFRSKAFPGSSNSGQSRFQNSAPNNIATEDDIRILEDNIAYLTEQVEKYENNIGTETDRFLIDFLNRELEEQKKLNTDLSAQLLENAENVIKRDSSIIMKALDAPEQALDNTSKMVEQVFDTQSKTNYFLWAAVFVLITLYSLLIFFNKGPKTVYLKPKNNQDKNSNNDTENNQSEPSNATVAPITPETLQAELTKAYEDDSVLQSDLKTIKQSAVKMSVGQKHEASQILKDWLDDGKSDEGNNNETTDEENK